MSDGPTPARLTHLDERGRARMVDVSAKPPLARRARASARVAAPPEVLRAAAAGDNPKGDLAAVARVAGIQAAKRTAELIPLCHPLPIEQVSVDVEIAAERGAVEIAAEVRTTARTGVEMEALTAASVAALSVYDMLKGLSGDLTIERIRLLSKETGAAAEAAPGGHGDSDRLQ